MMFGTFPCLIFPVMAKWEWRNRQWMQQHFYQPASVSESNDMKIVCNHHSFIVCTFGETIVFSGFMFAMYANKLCAKCVIYQWTWYMNVNVCMLVHFLQRHTHRERKRARATVSFPFYRNARTRISYKLPLAVLPSISHTLTEKSSAICKRAATTENNGLKNISKHLLISTICSSFCIEFWNFGM